MKALFALMLSINLLSAHKLEITFTDISDSKGGSILVAVCNDKAPFPCNRKTALVKAKNKVSSSTSNFSFELPDGIYAIVGGHDENSNDKIDKNFIGIPKEGYAISGRESTIPSYDEAKFSISNDTKINLKMRY